MIMPADTDIGCMMRLVITFLDEKWTCTVTSLTNVVRPPTMPQDVLFVYVLLSGENGAARARCFDVCFDPAASGVSAN